MPFRAFSLQKEAILSFDVRFLGQALSSVARKHAAGRRECKKRLVLVTF